MIISPLNNEEFSNIAPSFNISIIEEDLNSLWYIIGNNQEVIYIESMEGAIDQESWDNTDEGLITITFYAQDNAGNIGFMSVVINKQLPTSGIYGYHLFILIGLFSLASLLLIQRLKKKEFNPILN